MKIWLFHILIIIGEENKMREIVKISAMADALRNTGYKNIESAMSEIIDNSIQWYAKNVFVIVTESFNKHTGRNHISEIAFLDDGCGMDEETLGGCIWVYNKFTKRRYGKIWSRIATSIYVCLPKSRSILMARR